MQQYDALYDNDWSLLVSFLPDEWREKAIELGAIERFRAFPDVDSLLRTLLALAAEGLSFRDGAARATWWGCANVSDVAIFKRLKAAGSWLQWIAESMMEQWVNTTPWEWLGPDAHLKVNDATTVQEPGSKGTTWRLHYSMGLPSLSCAELHLTGQKVGESFMRFSVSPGDVFMGDRGYAHASGVAYVVLRGGNVLVRVNLYCMRFFDEKGERIPLLQRLTSLSDGEIGDWDVWVAHNKKLIPGRICAQRLSEADQQKALSRVRKKAAKQGRKLKPETLEAAKYM